MNANTPERVTVTFTVVAEVRRINGLPLGGDDLDAQLAAALDRRFPHVLDIDADNGMFVLLEVHDWATTAQLGAHVTAEVAR